MGGGGRRVGAAGDRSENDGCVRAEIGIQKIVAIEA